MPNSSRGPNFSALVSSRLANDIEGSAYDPRISLRSDGSRREYAPSKLARERRALPTDIEVATRVASQPTPLLRNRRGRRRRPLPPAVTSGPRPSPSYAIKTFGCQMNVHDSERMRRGAAASGYAAGRRAEDADLIVLNTCSVREKAEQKLRSEVGTPRRAQARRPETGHRGRRLRGPAGGREAARAHEQIDS